MTISGFCPFNRQGHTPTGTDYLVSKLDFQRKSLRPHYQKLFDVNAQVPFSFIVCKHKYFRCHTSLNLHSDLLFTISTCGFIISNI